MNSLKALSRIFLLTLLSLIIFSHFAFAMDENISPVKNHEKKWRIGYIEAGTSVDDYERSLKGLIEGLMQLKWIIKQDFSLGNKKNEDIWKFLSKLDEKSPYIEFVADAFWKSGGDEDANNRKKNKALVIDRLNQKKDIDMMIAMGTYAGQDMANDLHKTNVMIMEASNPVQSGIIPNEDDSGRPYIHVMVESDRYKDQIQFFYDKFNFKKLGIVYIDSDDGRAFAALDAIYDMKKKLKFNLILCQIQDNLSENEKTQSVLKCYDELAKKTDSMYLTSHLFDATGENMKNILKPILDHKIPTWSQAGTMEVGYGALMSFIKPDYGDIGYFHAKVMAQILRGVPPGKISQKFVNPKGEEIALNLKTAKLIQYNPSLEVLSSAEYVYETIKDK